MCPENMLLTNYHTHTCYSDGKSHPEEYIISAIEQKLYALGFSCHAPVPFKTNWTMKFEHLYSYLNELNNLKKKYDEKLKIFVGLEIDYVKGLCGYHQYKNIGLDYSIGGVHFLGFLNDGSSWDFDREKDWFIKGLDEIFNGDIKKLISFYYEQIQNMIETEKTAILAHLDLIKKFNSGNLFFNESSSWYRDIVFGLLDHVAISGTIIELNTRGVLKQLNSEFYPSGFILKRCLELKIPVCLSSDAHQPKDVLALLHEAGNLLKSIGYKEVFILEQNGWNPVPIE